MMERQVTSRELLLCHSFTATSTAANIASGIASFTCWCDGPQMIRKEEGTLGQNRELFFREAQGKNTREKTSILKA